MATIRRQNTVYGLNPALVTYGNYDGITNSPNSCKHINNNNDNVSPFQESSCSVSVVLGSRLENNNEGSGNALDESQNCSSCGDSQSTKKKKPKTMRFRKLLVLVILFVVYVSIGAVVFKSVESGPELERKVALETFIDDLLRNHSCMTRLEVFEIMMAAMEDSEIVFYVINNKTNLDRWDFSGSFGFVISVVTTIGFGNLSPFTMEGKAMCVAYALFGIPLTLMVLSGIGDKMAKCYTKFRKTRCSFCHRTPKINKYMNMLIIILFGTLVVFIAPALAFAYVEEWHFLEAIYFCFTTLSTIGFGDYIIGLHEKRLSSEILHHLYYVIAYVWILFGLAYLSLVYRVVTDAIVAKASNVEKKVAEKLAISLQPENTIHNQAF